MKRNKGSIPIYLLLLSAAAASLPCGASAVRAEPLRVDFSNRFSIGYDSFIDRFTILAEDTAESVHDLYAGIGNALTVSGRGGRLGINNLFRYGNQTIDEFLDIDAYSEPARRLRLDLRGSLRYKHFQKGSDYEFGNDYLQGNALVKIRTRLSQRLRAGVKGRIELVGYEERTLYDYDYRYHDAGFEIEAGSGYGNALLLGTSFGFRETPDTTALSYDRILAELEGRFARSGFSVHLSSLGDRKDYREGLRSAYWNVTSLLDMSFYAESGRSLSIRGESELIRYDRPDTVFFDTRFFRGGLRARFPLRGSVSLFMEPRYGRLSCRDFEEERYWEGTVILGLDALGGERYWLSVSYEPGYRDYTADENPLYSDFLVNRISIMGTVMFANSFSLNLFLNHEPEYHSRREDDFSITLLSFDLTKRF